MSAISRATLYGVVIKGDHVDVSESEKGAKIMATKAGFDTVTKREPGRRFAREVAHKKGGKWVSLSNGQHRYAAKDFIPETIK